MRKKVLVYPCDTEIGLEIYKAVRYATHYELYGGSSEYGHGQFVYKNHIDGLPFISDKSGYEEIQEFNDRIKKYEFDFIYPAMDGVITVFSKYRDWLKPCLISPDYETTLVTRSKRRTYEIFQGVLPLPHIYESADEIEQLPVFVKPDIGQGSVGAWKVLSERDLDRIDWNKELCLEYLPGEEYTIDCFTNSKGILVYTRGRKRKRIRNGISVNAEFVEDERFIKYAQIVNTKLNQKGGWFIQVKEARNGTLKLLEVSSRIAGASALSRCIGANLPLMTLDIFNDVQIDDIADNRYAIEIDRALDNRYKLSLEYDTVYVDYDDTLVQEGIVNTKIMQYLYQCLNHGKRLILLSRHDGDLESDLITYRMNGLFDQILHIPGGMLKSSFIREQKAIFIDDSYGERKDVYEKCKISVFDTNMVECLLED